MIGTLPLSASQGRDAATTTSGAPYDRWTAEQMKVPGALGSYGDHTASIQTRGASSAPEVHDILTHFMMFTTGDGEFVLGGTIVDGPDGRQRVSGGDTHKIVLGVMYHVPFGTVHWVVPGPGTSVTYWVTSITQGRPAPE